MRPSACACATRAVLQGCQPSSAGVAAPATASWRSEGSAHASAAASSSTAATPKPPRALGPSVGEPTAQATKASASSRPSRATAPSMPACTPSTHTSHTTVANIGKAISVLKCCIHTPGRGSARASAGQALAAK